MSIRAIPYQPVNFTEPLTVNTCKSDPIPALIGDEDPLIFEFGVGLCDDATQLLDDTTFATEDWQGGAGWNIATGKACAQGGFTDPLSYAGFSPAPGTTYVVRLTIDALNGGFVVSLGGDSVEVGELGTFDVALSAGNTDPLSITPVSDQVTGCFASVELFQQNTNIGFRIVGCDGDEAVTIYTATPDTAPQWFEYFRDIVRVNIPMPSIGIDQGCFAVEVFDSCNYGEEEVMQSQTFKVTTNCDKTILFRVCNDEPSMGLTGKYLQARIKSNITQPSYPQTVQEERLSDGRWVRHFADLQVVLTLNVEITDSTLHPFLAALFAFDHLYLDGREYLVDAQEYRPGYPEDGSNVGGSRFSIRPKQALLRRVLCDAQGEGCDPANDPICNTPNATIEAAWVGDQVFVNVLVLSDLGFPIGAIRWSRNGINQTPVTYTGPASYQLGPLTPGDDIVVTLPNSEDALCDFTFDAITVPCRSIVTFDILGAVEDENEMRFLTSTTFFAPTEAGFWAVLTPSGSYTETNGGTTSTYVTLFPNEDGRFCVAPSLAPALIQPNSNFTYLEFIGEGFITLDLSGCDGMPIRHLVLANVPNLNSVVLPSITASLLYLDLSGIALTTTEVDALLCALDGFETTGGTVILDGGNNAAPSTAGQACATSLIGKSWTVSVN